MPSKISDRIRVLLRSSGTASIRARTASSPFARCWNRNAIAVLITPAWAWTVSSTYLIQSLIAAIRSAVSGRIRGAGNRSSRYSQMTPDSTMTASPSTRVGTTPEGLSLR